ncbi:MAG: 2,3-bisphosphoglycerate-dependent phosphoglycerate mutase [Acidimicrobiaceae bacterium]|nr:2,3-bisphosphoglycerate-dependent phosphoglycerate mutase [Acidimicrobiaceae bacterium]MDE0664896.1 2,3-bisphosphoglycerate-dependent phosphoglycerate mutase [Acidimicrobiaceae bacterium]MXY10043.1 2,3-bisphosphoglycerate-dependent phosphoglycerate mutase [Acidimicrobiaceae bacterium]MXZ64368.1 2,3-bisphosphoglycerate-dependent phosphoglycerate mutase [Acidimicrobiaceae bacterium]MYF33404.1 2,3-bisphosphoglycerate-dependent phosphoglycerate mutase [Acidimicrobiaceae bacterium]
MAHDLILLRHGRSTWNDRNLFTGWHDCDLNETGRAEARRAAELLAEAGLIPTAVHTSVLRRATETTEIVLDALGLGALEVHRSWRLNERHYGDLTGLDKAATRAAHGDEQLQRWRRGYDTPPPPIRPDNEFNPNHSPLYADLAPELIPLTESLADVLARLLPYWHDVVIADLRPGHTVLVSAHGNSLRALAKHLDGISDDDIGALNIPTGMPLHYVLGPDMFPIEPKHPLERALDPDAAAAAAAEVAAQAHGP